MFFKIDVIAIEPTQESSEGEQLTKVEVRGKCHLQFWKMIFHYTQSGRFLEEKKYPLFGCKNYSKKDYNACMVLGTQYQTVPCPILTQHLEKIKFEVATYLFANNLVDKSKIGLHSNPLFQQILNENG